MILIRLLITVMYLTIFIQESVANKSSNRTDRLSQFSLQKPFIYRLQNGLLLVIYVDKRAPVVSHSIWYKVGAADEQKGESGLAHFFEHLMFKGTNSHPDGYFSKYVSEIGGEDNAYTTNDYTVYYQNVAKEYLPNVMKLEADRMVNLKISKDDFYSEKNVVLEERALRIDNNPTALLSEQMSAMLYRNHPYGSPTIGWRHEIEGLTLESAMRFYKKYYAPNNAVVTVVGDVSPHKVFITAQNTYGKNKISFNIKPYNRPDEPPQNIERFITLKDTKVTLPSLLYYIQGPNPKKSQKDIYALAIGLKAMGGDDQAYLYKKLVRDSNIAISISTYMSVETIDYPTLIVHAIPSKDNTLKKLNEEILNEIDLIAENGINKDDIILAKNDIIAEFIRSVDSRGNMARFLGVKFIKNTPIDEIINFPTFLSKISVDDVNRVIKESFKSENRVIGFLEQKD